MAKPLDPAIDVGRFFGDVTEVGKLPRKRRRRQDENSHSPSKNDSGSDTEQQGEADGDSDGAAPSPPASPPTPSYEAADVSIAHRPRRAKRLNTAQRNFDRQHLNVLHTILHKCLQEHDYERAGRAFATLIRLHIDGDHFDVRKMSLWGIGAEILLHRSAGASTLKKHEVLDLLGPADLVADDAFTAARQYFDRLILQYPYNKARPNALSAKQFTPIMFALRIFQARAKTSRDQKKLEASELAENLSVPDSTHLESDDSSDASDAVLTKTEIKLQELEQAREIKAALDELTSSPPYDKDAKLLSLLRNVCLWICDLVHDSDGDAVEAEAHLHAANVAFERASQLC